MKVVTDIWDWMANVTMVPAAFLFEGSVTDLPEFKSKRSLGTHQIARPRCDQHSSPSAAMLASCFDFFRPRSFCVATASSESALYWPKRPLSLRTPTINCAQFAECI